jgi:homoserine kinase
MPAKSNRSLHRSASLKLALPATSANLGPAFDTAALALGLFLNVRAHPAEEFSITARGRDAGICGQIENHLILTTYSEILERESKHIQPIALRIDNEIPIGKGCGSSAAARLAGIALAVHFGRLRWDDARIVGEASHREHHPDNAAACWYGGLAVARMWGDAQAQVASIVPKGKWPLLLAVPDEALSTEQSRRVFPEQYSRADAVVNIQNSMLLLAAFVQGRPDLLVSSLEDRIHQPYRASLCPLLPAIQELTGQAGILGSALSGAGPSVLIFLDSNTNIDRIITKIQGHLHNRGLSAELIPAEITRKGAREIRGWKVTPRADAAAPHC